MGALGPSETSSSAQTESLKSSLTLSLVFFSLAPCPRMADVTGVFLLGVVLFVACTVTGVRGTKFDGVIQASWALDHVIYDGELLKLKLDNFSGCGFASKNKYLYGKATAEIKLVEGDSAGTVTAFYVRFPGRELLNGGAHYLPFFLEKNKSNFYDPLRSQNSEILNPRDNI